MSKPRLATVWLDGCSGCHMSLLDLDERLLEIAERADIVYSPLVDIKDYPPDVDVCLVEGAVSSEEDLHKILLVRERTRTLVSLGTARSPPSAGHAQPIGSERLLERAYGENVTLRPGAPTSDVRRCCPWLAGPSGGPGRRVPAGLPTLRRPHLPRARGPARGPRPRHVRRPFRTLKETA